jgi:hypothetical protein
VFKAAEYVVCPSGSCTTMVRVFHLELLSFGPFGGEAVALAHQSSAVGTGRFVAQCHRHSSEIPS